MPFFGPPCILLQWYLMNAWNSLDETDREYSSLAPTDDRIRFCRSKVKVTAGRRDESDIHVDARASMSTISVVCSHRLSQLYIDYALYICVQMPVHLLQCCSRMPLISYTVGVFFKDLPCHAPTFLIWNNLLCDLVKQRPPRSYQSQTAVT